jgi:hypothetical protein
VWAALPMGTVIKRTEKKRVGEITRPRAHGLLGQAEPLRARSRGGAVLNTAFIERLENLTRHNAGMPLPASVRCTADCL